MMGNYPDVRRIVNERPGSGTGDTIYTDDRGDRWISGPAVVLTSGQSTTGVTYGKIIPGGIIARSR